MTEKRAFLLAFDGSGDQEGGIISSDLMSDLQKEGERERAVKESRDRERDRGHWHSRGRGRTQRLVRTAETREEGMTKLPGLTSTGYEHSHKGVELFESLPLA